MNEFERRWKLGARAARDRNPIKPELAPLGFTTRVVARWHARTGLTPAILWQDLALRVLGAMTLILVILATYGAISMQPDEIARPEIETAIVDSLALL